MGLICPKCADDMKLSKAIEPHPCVGCRTIVPVKTTLKASEINLIDVMKCVSCGHSEQEDKND